MLIFYFLQSSPPTAESDHPGAPHEWTIPRSSLTLTHKLGEGLFGFVWEGLYNKRYPVAIKSLKPGLSLRLLSHSDFHFLYLNNNFCAGKMDTKDFLFEASVMKTLYHRNLLKLYAVCTEKPVYIVTELMKNGSLLEFLRSEGFNLS